MQINVEKVSAKIRVRYVCFLIILIFFFVILCDVLCVTSWFNKISTHDSYYLIIFSIIFLFPKIKFRKYKPEGKILKSILLFPDFNVLEL